MTRPTPGAEQPVLDDESIRQRLGARLRELRVERGLSQEGVAERAGMTYKHVGEVERGDSNPSATSLVRIAIGLGVTVGELFETITPASVVPLPRRTIGVVREAIGSLTAMLDELSGAPLLPAAGAPSRYRLKRLRTPRKRAKS